MIVPGVPPPGLPPPFRPPPRKPAPPYPSSPHMPPYNPNLPPIPMGPPTLPGYPSKVVLPPGNDEARSYYALIFVSVGIVLCLIPTCWMYWRGLPVWVSYMQDDIRRDKRNYRVASSMPSFEAKIHPSIQNEELPTPRRQKHTTGLASVSPKVALSCNDMKPGEANAIVGAVSPPVKRLLQDTDPSVTMRQHQGSRMLIAVRVPWRGARRAQTSTVASASASQQNSRISSIFAGMAAKWKDSFAEF